MPLVDAYASAQHYHAHLAPIWEALPDEVRGVFWQPGSDRYQWGQRLDLQHRDESRVVLVASFVDAQRMAPSPLVLVEHGAGQTYNDPRLAGHGSYPGGSELGRVRLFVCPNDHVADAWLATYPNCRTVVVGCPFMDRWHRSENRE